jgi:hypothetical protein
MQHPNSDYDGGADSDTDSEHFHARGCAPGASEAVPILTCRSIMFEESSL